MSAAGKARVPAWVWVALLAAAAAAVFILRPAADERDAAEATVVTTLPRLIDLGADKCVPCKMMAPVLEELTAEYADRFEVEFIDVWKQPERGDAYAVNLIPTQIFLAADGTELFRHEGFFAKDDILAKWRELGLELRPEAQELEGLFIRLTDAVSGPLGPAVAAAFAWGVLSIVLSPCHLASIPLIVAFLQGGAPPGRGRALLLSSLFALGILTTIALIGGLTAAAGRILGDVGAAGNVLVALLFLAVGLAFLDVVPWNLPVPERARPRRGAAAALLLGLVFGLALGPCTFAFMAPVLGVALRSSADHAWQGAALLTAYGLGHCLVIALAGAGSAWVQRVLDWNEDSRAAVVIRRTCGALIILAGLYLLYTAP